MSMAGDWRWVPGSSLSGSLMTGRSPTRRSTPGSRNGRPWIGPPRSTSPSGSGVELADLPLRGRFQVGFGGVLVPVGSTLQRFVRGTWLALFDGWPWECWLAPGGWSRRRGSDGPPRRGSARGLRPRICCAGGWGPGATWTGSWWWSRRRLSTGAPSGRCSARLDRALRWSCPSLPRPQRDTPPRRGPSCCTSTPIAGSSASCSGRRCPRTATW